MQNDQFLTRLVEEAGLEAWGQDRVLILSEPSMGAEDFSLYLQQAPGTMFRLGVGSPNLLNPPLHHPEFLVDESAILTGVITLAYAAYKYWQRED